MGEYATHNQQSIKIGTCEDMYYLRFDQRQLVRHEPGNVDVNHAETAAALRFRFPFPEEDEVQPGCFDDYSKSLIIPGAIAPEGVDHRQVQFTSAKGYNCCLPCPESTGPHPVKTHRNGFPGAVAITQQRLVGRQLWTVCECKGCGTKWRCDEESAQQLAVALRSRADKETPHTARYLHTVADRILAGYTITDTILA
jgi:hypothetical protein